MMYDINAKSTIAELAYEAADIQVISYELYKADWLKEHVTAGMQNDAIKRWYETEFKPNAETTLNPYTGEACREFDGRPFEVWIEEDQYDGFGIYVSFEDFLDNEYLNDCIMGELLGDSLMAERNADICKMAV